MCPHSNSPAEGVTLMTSTPSGRAISWLYRLCVVRLRRQALCRLEVQGLLFGGTGGLNMSKLNGELFAGEAVSASFSLAVSSGGTQVGGGGMSRKKNYQTQFNYFSGLLSDTSLFTREESTSVFLL